MVLSIDNSLNNEPASTVIIVDDQSVNRMVLSKTLKSIEPDVAVKTFKNATAALTAADTSTPDLVITDYKMPIMNGIEFARQLVNSITAPMFPSS